MINHLLQRYPFLSSLGINALLFALFLGTWYTRYGTTDDVEMQLVVAGQCVLPDPSAQLRWTHWILGQCLSTLYTWVPSMPWYGYYLTSTHFMGMTLLLYWWLVVRPNGWTIGFFTAFFAVGETVLLQELQYTSSALVLGIGSVWLLFGAIEADRRRPLWWLAGSATLLWVTMMRWDAFQLTVVLGGPLLLYAIVRQERDRLRHLLYGTAILAAAWSLNQVHYWVQNQDPAWEQYNAYKHSLAAHDILDYRKPQYHWSPSTADDYYYGVGWSYEDLRLFEHWFFADSVVYGLPQFQAAQARFQNCSYPEGHLEERAWQFWVAFAWQDYVFYGLLFLGICLLLVPADRWTYGLLSLSVGLVTALLFVLFLYKHLPERVSFPLAFYWMTIGGWLWTQVNLEHRRMVAHALLLLALLGGSSLKLVTHRSNLTATQQVAWTAALDSLNPRPEQLYIGGGDFYLQHILTPYHPTNDTLLKRFNMLDFGHLANSPHHAQQLAHFGIQNIHTTAPIDTNIYFMHRYYASIMPWYASFVQRHYNRYIEYDLLQHHPKLNIAVYQIKEQIRLEPNSQGISLSNQEAMGIPIKAPNAIEPDTTKPQATYTERIFFKIPE